ncbi:hypothetical protein HNP84_010388, partial [Thermocatellispora tengchongensis]|nr:hypothetical protein [Thermocatellispora tengchongensis]
MDGFTGSIAGAPRPPSSGTRHGRVRAATAAVIAALLAVCQPVVTAGPA